MAGKYHYISALAEMTAADIVKNENEWWHLWQKGQKPCVTDRYSLMRTIC